MKTILIFATLLFAACTSDQEPPESCIDPTKTDGVWTCPAVYDPVCGCNDVTYSNACHAIGQGVLHWQEGACK